MSDATPEELTYQDGGLSMAISREMVALIKDYFGRGPTKSRTYLRDNLIVVIMEDTMTKAELTLVKSGNVREVRELRRLFQETLREGAVELIERLSGRKVAAFMSDHDTERDVAAEIFVLEPADGDGESGIVRS